MRAQLAVLAFVALTIFGCFYGVFAVPIYDVTLVSLEPGTDPQCPVGADCSKTLELRFRTTVNLRRLVRDTGAITPLLQIGLCPYDDEYSVGISTIFHNGIEITTNPGNICTREDVHAGRCRFADDDAATLAEMETMKSNKPLTYSAYFEYGKVVHLDENTHSTVFEPLPKTPPDLCFKIFTPRSEFTPTEFVSSTVRVPASVLRHALQDLQKRRALEPD